MSVGALWRKTGTYFVPRIMDMGKLQSLVSLRVVCWFGLIKKKKGNIVLRAQGNDQTLVDFFSVRNI